MPRGKAGRVHPPADPPLEPEIGTLPLVREKEPNQKSPWLVQFQRKPGNQMARGHNRGKRGRPASFVKEASRMGYYTRIPMLKRIADGEEYRTVQVVEINPETKQREVFSIRIYPTLQDRMRAVDILGKYGGLTIAKEEEEGDGDEGDELQGLDLDFTKLTDAQLEMLQVLLTAAKPDAQLESGE